MIRCFVALPLPEEVRDALDRLQSGLPLPRPTDPEGMHLTLAFLGDQPEAAVEEAHLALSALAAPGFELELEGVGLFGGARPRVAWAGVRPSAPLVALQRKVVTALRLAGITPEARRFSPHVTLGRLRGGRDEAARIEAAAVAAAGFRAGPWHVEGFALWRSDPGPAGRTYTPLADYRLTAR